MGKIFKDDINGLIAVVGLGKTGLSACNYLSTNNYNFFAIDTKLTKSELEKVQSGFSNTDFYNNLDPKILLQASTIILSPGISPKLPILQQAKAKGIELINDIELLAKILNNISAQHKPKVIGVTGTNGKSTVVTLLGKIAEYNNLVAPVVGNIGEPVLNLALNNQLEKTDIIIIELSSYQLELTENLNLDIALILNITPDHMDRYADLTEYALAKFKIAKHAKQLLISNDIFNKYAPFAKHNLKSAKIFKFDDKSLVNWQIQDNNLVFKNEPRLDLSQLKITGLHNYQNIIICLIISDLLTLSQAKALLAIKDFTGLDHRCQKVLEKNEIVWLNDSKSTNVASTEAALEGVGKIILPGKIVLLIGGDHKNANFSPLTNLINKYCRALIVIGKDPAPILRDLQNTAPYQIADSMQHACQLAAKCALPQDRVLLSPACASFDEYKNFIERGQVFAATVHDLLK